MRKDFVYLASASPRRRELLRQIGVRFEVRPASLDEMRLPEESPETYVRRLAAAKAASVWDGLTPDRRPVLAADTAVVLDGRILGKPEDRGAATAMLEQLSGRAHRVLTAVALRWEERAEVAVSASEVRFRATTGAERRAYSETDEPLDKAGGYAIQGLGAVFIESLSGSYSAVVGLPLFETARLLALAGVPVWDERSGA
jgi:septum formation protein